MEMQQITDRKPRVRRARSAGAYIVESRTRPGVAYVTNTRYLVCNCQAGKFGTRCWHITFCVGLEDWRRRQHEQAKAASWGSAPARATESGMATLVAAFS